jgi:hypothetical protein
MYKDLDDEVETREVYVVSEELIDKQLFELLKWAEKQKQGYFDDLEKSMYAPALQDLTSHQKDEIRSPARSDL